jgi:large subunit ribosomal protein L37Ae
MIIVTKKKKVGSTGRFGARYGRRVKVVLKEIEKKQKALYVCPSCKRKALRRISAGIWKCRKCNAKFAGGAYTPTTESTAME